MKSAFRAAVEACAPLRPCVRPGLQAVRRIDRARVRVRHPRRLAGSVDVDSALREELPDVPRWDYAIAHQTSPRGRDMVHWVEVHPATDREVSTIERKLKWLKDWLCINAALLKKLPSRFIWISSGKSSLTPSAPSLRRLAQAGCVHVGRTYEIA